MTEYSKYPDNLWAPWRLSYIKGNVGTSSLPEPDTWLPGADKACFLCRVTGLSEKYDRDAGVLERTNQSIVILNRYPYTNGHLLIAPLQHHATLLEIDAPVLLELQQQLAVWCQRLTKAIEAQGFNVGLNLGQVAGAGVPGHLHWHLVPRWPGDVNFMTSCAGTRVIPQSLDELWEELRAYR